MKTLTSMQLFTNVFRWFFIVTVGAIIPCVFFYIAYSSYIKFQLISTLSVQTIELHHNVLSKMEKNSNKKIPKKVIFSHYRLSTPTPVPLIKLLGIEPYTNLGTATTISSTQFINLWTCDY